MIRAMFIFTAIALLLFTQCADSEKTVVKPDFSVLLMAGEPNTTSVLLQARVQAGDTLVGHSLPGKSVRCRFELSTDPKFEEDLQQSAWLVGEAANDFIVRESFGDLKPGTTYHYRVCKETENDAMACSPVHTLKTLHGAESTESISFVMVTGSHHERFYYGAKVGEGNDPTKWRRSPLAPSDSLLGFPALAQIEKLAPNFFIGNGDNVYYDHNPSGDIVRTLEAMRAKWQRQFLQPRYRSLFASVPTVWMKDDHDYRFDDADTAEVSQRFGSEPSHALGKAVFAEQVPVLPQGKEEPMYRSFRLNKHVEIWLVENRDYRSPNDMPDGPEKTIWGETQRNWLKEGLLNSDATFKLLISPTPMVGPDDAWKRDNHVNPEGFSHEGAAFFDWLAEMEIPTDRFFILCGDRHWQYHSVHPSGYQELSCGALVRENSRLGRNPGDPESTDPLGKIRQPFTAQQATGGFLHTQVAESADDGVKLLASFYNEHGDIVYQFEEKADLR